MAVRKEITIQHGFSQEEITDAVKATLLLLGGCEERSPLIFESDICASWIEWPGFRLTVDVTREGIIKIASESKVPWALFDWGVNREKIKKFVDSLKHTLLISGLDKSKPEAYSSFMLNKSTHIEGRSFSEVVLPFILIFVLTTTIGLILAGAVIFVCIVLMLFLTAI